MTDLAAHIQHSDGTWHQLDDWTTIHVLRNPHGWTEEAIRACRHFAADILDEARKAAHRPSAPPMHVSSPPAADKGE